ncbi:MAG: Beta-glucosidase [Acidimicrobiaceae bacterium]|nr:Beta-glucosidase [Acidimicrobiaceae bacterium]
MTTTGDGSAADGLSFPQGFVWGAATAAYQIEGAATEDGRGASVWDTFSHTPGKVCRGDTGDIACDSYHRYRDDVALLSGLGLHSYRFSVSWPRVQPGGRGPVNQKGLDYYRALVDELAEHDIAATLTLYHWDLPQELQDEGGWAVRSTAGRFAEYAGIMAEALGDQVSRWITLNEPQVVASHGYREGEHAPGLRDWPAAAAATHHLLLAHGMATETLRAILPSGTPVGITLNLYPVRTEGDGLEEARERCDAEANRIFLDPVLHGRYPHAARPEFLPPADLVASGDLETIHQPIDFLGVNYYSPTHLRRGEPENLRRGERPFDLGLPGVVGYDPEGLEKTNMGWLIEPDGLFDLLVGLSAEAPGLALYVTENGCAAEDYVNPEGEVVDVERVKYLHTHLAACARAIEAGANLAGYFAWSLLDNFEWAWGYQKRFGIAFVDFPTGERVVKHSGHFYAELVRTGVVPPFPQTWPT